MEKIKNWVWIVAVGGLSYASFIFYGYQELDEIINQPASWFLEIPHMIMITFLLVVLPFAVYNISRSLKNDEESASLWRRFSVVFVLPYIVVVTYIAAEWSEIEEAWLSWLTKPSHFLIVLINGILIPAILWVIVKNFIRLWIDRERYLRRIEELENELRSFVHPEVYKRIYEKTSLEEKGSFKIIMADMQSFTRFCEQHRAREVAELANEFCDLMDHYIKQVGGITLSYAGDLVFALFNESADSEEILKTGRSMQRAFQSYVNQKFPGWATNLNIGIHFSHDIVLGTIGGVSAQKHFTANGFGICEVSRICSEAANGQILVSETFLKTLPAAPGLRVKEVSWSKPPKNIERPIKIFDIQRELVAA
ncbi:MAG: adenylate/guanylate cyclase domain-containing protein [Bacteroidetes bacterium]|nr:adenylate/guanylate cyclase domain-containing protein [Bacteroidota bacterium]